MNEFVFYEEILGLPDLQITAIEKKQTKLLIHGRFIVKQAHCPICQQLTGVINQVEVRKFRDLKISEREVWLHLILPQFHCFTCNRYFFEHPTWVEPGKSYTRRQAKWIFELCEKQAFTQVAALADMCHKTVERLFYRTAKNYINLPKRYAQVRKLGIDEIAHRKGKKAYVCVLTDLERGIQLDLLPNRKKSTLLAHFRTLGDKFCQQIQAVSCDIWPPYLQVAAACFPQAYVVIDRFHVVKLLNNVLNTERRKVRHLFSKKDDFKKLKWLLFKRKNACSEEENLYLASAFKQAPTLERLYQLCVQFNELFDQAVSKNDLVEGLKKWMKKAQEQTNFLLDKFSKTLITWQEQITNFAKERLTNAVTEGLNNYLRYVKRISFGLPNFENMRTRILVASA